MGRIFPTFEFKFKLEDSFLMIDQNFWAVIELNKIKSGKDLCEMIKHFEFYDPFHNVPSPEFDNLGLAYDNASGSHFRLHALFSVSKV